jgi:CBS domain-containing protein
MMNTDEDAFVVMEGNRVVGMVSLEDMRKLPREVWERTTVREIMTPIERLAVATPEEDVSEALSEITNRDVRQLPVVKDGRLVGMLRRRDIVKWLQLQSDYAVG